MPITMYYAVAVGREPGIYNTWEECRSQIHGFPGAKFKKFGSLVDAERFAAGMRPIQVETDMIQNQLVAEGEPLVAFVDGSALDNGRPNSCAGYAVVWPDHPDHDICSAVPPDYAQTNNAAEYMAGRAALQKAAVIDPEYQRPLHIYTDSALLLKCVTSWIPRWKVTGWKTSNGAGVSHKEILQEIDALMGRRKVQWIHVPAHTGCGDWKSQWNDKADRLAKMAALTNRSGGVQVIRTL